MKFDVSLHTVDRSRYISGRLGITALVMLFILSCAKISAPTGGPKDVDPPVIIKSQPENSSTMFSSKSFAITFNEYVVLDRITEKFMVSPPLADKPEVVLKGKSLHVTWEDELADSTTYTFYFQDAIRDNNEGNPIPNYQYVFSTGPVLDSLSLTGNVFNASDLEVVEDITIMMYSNLSDTAPRTILPAYISRPDPSGGFMINNMRPGSYRLYALRDLNGNSRYDLDDETFAFCDSVIVVTPADNYMVFPDTVKYKPATATETTKPDLFIFGQYRLYAFRQELKKQYLKFTERKNSWSFGFGLAVPSDSGQVSLAITDADTASWFLEHNVARDTFMVWITNPEVYDRDLIEAILTYPFTDSTGAMTERIDTINLRYQKPAPPRGGPAKTPPLTLTTNASGRQRPGTTLHFVSATPLADPDTSLITLIQTVDTVKTKLEYGFIRDTTTERRLFMKAAVAPGGSYSLTCRAGAFKDIFGNATDSTLYRFSVATEEDYGSIKAKLTGYEGNVIIQLMADKEKIVAEEYVSCPGEVTFPLLDKGRYRLKAVYDLDSNRVWTTGDYDTGRNPEPVSYYPAELEVKINWALEQDWDLGVKYMKDVSIRNKPVTKR
jgi:uncharacterized protein (DUF2141 family)